MAQLKQSTAYTRMFLMVDSTDHITGKTGLTVTLTLSKAGGTFAAAGGSVTEVSSGWYKASLNTTDTNTVGDLAYHATATGADPTDFTDQVISGSPGGTVDANLVSVDGVANATHASGMVPADVRDIVGAAVSTTTAQLGVNTVKYNNQTAQTDVNNLPKVDVEAWEGSSVLALQNGYVPAITGLRTANAQAGTANTVTLDASASAVNDHYTGDQIIVYLGDGGQVRTITSYNGSTKVATVDRNWDTNPSTQAFTIIADDSPKLDSSLRVTAVNSSGGTTFDANVVTWEGVAPNALISGRVDSNTQAMANNVVTAAAIADAAIDRATFAVDTGLQSVRSNTAQSGSSSTITLDAGASALSNFYNGETIYLTGGTGVGQDRIIVSYNGATKVASIGRNWVTNPDATTTFAIQPTSSPKINDNLEVTAADGVSTTLSPSERNAVADAILDRNMATGVDSGTDLTIRTVRQALRTIRNKSCIVGTTQTVYKEDDATPDHNMSLVGTPGANPVTCATPT